MFQSRLCTVVVVVVVVIFSLSSLVKFALAIV